MFSEERKHIADRSETNMLKMKKSPTWDLFALLLSIYSTSAWYNCHRCLAFSSRHGSLSCRQQGFRPPLECRRRQQQEQQRSPFAIHDIAINRLPHVGRLISTKTFLVASQDDGKVNSNSTAVQTEIATKTSSSPTTIATATASSGTFMGNEDKERKDSLEQFSADVTKVCNELRPGNRDSTLPPPFRRQRRTGHPSMTATWTVNDWDLHSSRKRYIHWLVGFFQSRLLQRVLPMLSAHVVWSSLAVWTWKRIMTESFASKVVIPLSSLSLMSSFVAFLLTLRSNQGLSRLNDGRKAIGEMVLYSREMGSLIASTIYPRDQQLGLTLIRYVSIFGWLLKGFLRGSAVNGTDEDIISTMLPTQADVNYVLRQRKPPMAVVCKLRQAFFHLGKNHQLSTAEEIALDHCTQYLNRCIMITEKILASPIPPLYTALTGRLMVFYLLMLPYALQAANVVGGVGTVIISTAVGYAMIALDELSHLCEQPFRLMPLFQLSKKSMMDAADCVLQRPPDFETGEDISAYCPAYWPIDYRKGLDF